MLAADHLAGHQGDQMALVACRVTHPGNATKSMKKVITMRRPEPQETTLDLVSQIRSQKSALSAGKLAEILSCTSSYILKSAKAGKIPSYRIGGMVRFDPIRTADWLESKAA